jgi:hypothetical protein
MFRCLRTSRVAQDPIDHRLIAHIAEMRGAVLIDQCNGLNRQELIEVCQRMANNLHESRAHAQGLQERYSTLNPQLEQLRTEVVQLNDRVERERHAHLQTMRAHATQRQAERGLHDEMNRLTDSEAGLRGAFNRHELQIASLRAELASLRVSPTRSDPPPTDRQVDKLIQHCHKTLELMENILTDPVTSELLDDPVTIESGHTYNRRTLEHLTRISSESYAIRCPMSQAWTRQCLSNDVSIMTRTMMDIYISLKAELEGMKCDDEGAAARGTSTELEGMSCDDEGAAATHA